MDTLSIPQMWLYSFVASLLYYVVSLVLLARVIDRLDKTNKALVLSLEMKMDAAKKGAA